MKFTKMLGLLAVAAAALMAFAGSASGTLTSPSGVAYSGTIHGSSEGSLTMTGSLTIPCNNSTLAAEITTNDENEASGPVTTLTLEECGNDTITVNSEGTLTVTDEGGNTAKVYSTNTEITWLMHRPFVGTVHCIYKTTNTFIGTLTGSNHGSNTTATLDISSSLERVLTAPFCGTHSTWEGSYSVSGSDQLGLDQLYIDTAGTDGTILTSPEGTQVPAGTAIRAESEGTTSLTGSLTVTCQESTIEGEITNAGGATSTVGGSISSLTFGECGEDTVTAVGLGSLELHSLGEDTGTLTSTGTEITVLTHRPFVGTVHCIYKTNETDLGTLTGSSTTGATATLDIGPVSIPRVTTSFGCGTHSTWEGSYSISGSDRMLID
jgi:hypothetical protein